MDLMAFMESMGTSDIPAIAAFFIGLMTAISPCPMATNITAIAYMSRKIDNNKHTLFIGLLYTAGRMLAYTALASLIVWVGLSTQTISLLLQGQGERILGPFLILIGILMLGVVKIKFFKGSEHINNLGKRLSEKGYVGGFLLGIIFALAFCPFSAVLFFGMLIPLCISTGDSFILPSIFAMGTGFPVVLFSFILVYSVSRIGTIMHKLQMFETWVRKLAALIFIIVGLYYSLVFF